MQNTTEKKTENGHIIIVKDFITGLEKRKLMNQLYEEEDPEQKKPIAERINLSNDLEIEVAIISIDGKTENLAQEALSLPLHDYNEVMAFAKAIVLGKKKEAIMPTT